MLYLIVVNVTESVWKKIILLIGSVINGKIRGNCMCDFAALNAVICSSACQV
jgi:hypothetical protein